MDANNGGRSHLPPRGLGFSCPSPGLLQGHELLTPNVAILQSPSGPQAYHPGEQLGQVITRAVEALYRLVPGIRSNEGEGQNGDDKCGCEGQRKPLSKEPVYARSPSRPGSFRLVGWDLVKAPSPLAHTP